MCGIAGLVGTNPKDRIAAMLQSIEHRGRDDEGVWTSDPIDDAWHGRRARGASPGTTRAPHAQDARATFACLGHRRLSIIDTSPAGHQPMLSADGRFVVTLNGEIYNYRELREELRSKRHT